MLPISMVTLMGCIGCLSMSSFAKGRHDPPEGNQKLKENAEKIFKDGNKTESTLNGWTWNNFFFEGKLALSADGNTLLIGENRADVDGHDYYETGVAYILEKNGDVWVLKKKIVGNKDDYLGYDVALSADGNTALIGASGIQCDGNNHGGAFIYAKNGDTWELKQEIINSRITPPGGREIQTVFGSGTSLSADGKIATIVNGGGGYFSGDGYVTLAAVVYVYVKNGDTWQLQQTIEDPVITGKRDDGATLDDFGFFVKVSPDGNNLLITDPYEGGRTDGSAGNYGSLYFYERNGDSWELKQAIDNPFKDILDDNSGLMGIEDHIAFSDDWTTLLASFPGANGTDYGTESASLIYKKIDGLWQLQQTIKKNLGGYWYLGDGSAMSGDGNTILMSMAPVSTEMCDIMREWDLTGDSYLEQPDVWIDDPEPLANFTTKFGSPSVLNYDGTIAVLGNKSNDKKFEIVNIYKKNRSVDFGWELLETVKISQDTTITIEPNTKTKSA